ETEDNSCLDCNEEASADDENSEEKNEETDSESQEEPTQEEKNQDSNTATEAEDKEDETEDGTEENTSENSEEPAQEIETGDAIAQSDIFNELNINITGENWEDVVINLYNDHKEDIDLLGIIDKIVDNEYLTEEQADKIINNENIAELKNNASSSANSGENNIEEANSNDKVEIGTGDAEAKSNIVNLVNKNIVGNNWVFAVINVFGKWKGDLIVPGEDLIKFQNMLINNEVEIENKNEAEIENISKTLANTGDNSIDKSSESAQINTGDAYTESDVSSQINTNIIENGWFNLNINNLGSWLGSTQGWESSELEKDLSFDYKIDSEEKTENDNQIKINNDNQANIVNTATAESNTGKNSSSNGKDAKISTGDASSFTNIANLANLNIIGNNWVYTIVNILGSWSGNLIFAYPDLEIIISNNQESISPSENNQYTVTYFNKGKARAKDITISVNLPEDVNYTNTDQNYSFTIPEMPAGEEGSFHLSTSVKDEGKIKNNYLLAKAKIETKSEEKEMANNTHSDKTTILFSKKQEEEHVADLKDKNSNETAPLIKKTKNPSKQNDPTVEHQDYSKIDIDAEIKLTRKVNSSSLNFGEMATHEIIIENEGNTPVYDIKLKDEMDYLTGEEKKVVEYEWEVGYLGKDEAVLIQYQILINETAKPGNYEFEAVAKGINVAEEEIKSNKSKLPVKVNQVPVQISRIIQKQENKEEEKPPFEIINNARAFDNFVSVQGGADILNTNYPPPWILISALISYALAINWAIFPNLGASSVRPDNNFRLLLAPAIFTALFFTFWYFISYGNWHSNLWFPLSGLFIIILHFYYKFFPLKTLNKIKSTKF
ncbi:MAG: hypothetical protein R6V40_03015, partial [Candidatus Moraniibacteriota bacterium]